MKIVFPWAQPITLRYDGAFTVGTFEDKNYQLDEVMETIAGDFDTYGFDECTILNALTGEVIAVVYNE
jgi:hypothetical protein